MLLSSRPTGHVDAERGLEDGDLSTLREYVWLVLLVVLEHHCVPYSSPASSAIHAINLVLTRMNRVCIQCNLLAQFNGEFVHRVCWLLVVDCWLLLFCEQTRAAAGDVSEVSLRVYGIPQKTCCCDLKLGVKSSTKRSMVAWVLFHQRIKTHGAILRLMEVGV